MKQSFIFRESFRFILFSALLMAMFFPFLAFGQEIKDENHLPENRKDVAAVSLDGNLWFFVVGTASFPAEERADLISRQIGKAASDRSIPADSVKILTEGDYLNIYAGKMFIMSVTKFDAKAEGTNQIVFSRIIQKQVRAAINSYRHERSRPVILKKILYASAATVLMVLSLILILWLIRRLNRVVETRIKSKVEAMENKSYKIIRSSSLWKVVSITFRMIKIAVIVLIVAAFLQYILGLFPVTMGFASYTLGLFLNPLISIGKAFVNFLPSLAFLIIIYLVARYLLKLIKLFFTSIHQGGIRLSKFEDEWAMPTYKILRLVVIVFALVVAYPYIPGSETSAFKGISVFLGVLLSLGSSSFISNIIAGYSMTYRAAFKAGDLIEVDDQIGFVEEQKLLVTRLRSPKNKEISIPNSELLNSNIINYSKRAKDLGLILHTTLGIGYETPWRLVDAMLKEAAGRTEGLLKQPPPFVRKASLDSFCVKYELNAYCNDVVQIFFYYSQLHQNILDVFNENNVQIMVPAYEGDPPEPKIVPKDKWNATGGSGTINGS